MPQQRVSDARVVLAHSHELAKAVIRNDKPLRAALDEARLSQGSVRNNRAKLGKLRDERPDLAELVANEVMPLDDAVKKATEDAEELKQLQWAATTNILDSLGCLDRPPDTAPEQIKLFNAAFAESRGEKVTAARLRRAAEYLGRLADAMEVLK